jgi:hypothetical protein
MLRRLATSSHLARLVPRHSAPALLQPAVWRTTPALARALCAKAPHEKDTPADSTAANGNSDAGSTDAGTDPSKQPSAFEGPQGGEGEGVKGLTLQDHDGENLPPLQFEPGVAGAAQKGVSAIVIAFGAAAFGACAYGISFALFPSATSTQVIYSEAFDLVQKDPTVAYTVGTPMKAHGIDHGSARGRRNAMERWEVQEDGKEWSVVRFAVAGPQGVGLVQVQAPSNRRRGEFRYIIFENRRSRQLVHVLDRRAEEAAAKAAEAERAAAEAAAAAAAAASAASAASAGSAPMSG